MVSVHLPLVSEHLLTNQEEILVSEKRMTSEDRRLRILASVRGLFCSKGLNVTSKELSEAAGVSEALIYKHFGSKEELYKALVDKTCRAHHGVGQELAEQEASTQVLVCATYLLVHIMTGGMQNPDEDFSLTPEEVRGLLLQSFQSDGEVARTIFEQGLGPWVKYFIDGMDVATKCGDMVAQEFDFETLVWITHHAALGVKMTLHPEPNAFMVKKADEEKIKQNLFIFVLRGMGLIDKAIQKYTKSNEFKIFKTKLLGI